MILSSLFSKLRLPKLSRKAWITLKELPKYFDKVIWITRTEQHNDAYKILRLRITKLIKRSGFQFTFFYLKEVLRLVIRSLSGSPETSFHKGVMVKVDHTGLPTIIPLSLRIALRDYRNNQVLVACILSLLSVFRVFPTKVKPSLGTIIAPFDGVTRTFDSTAISLALAELIPKPVPIKPARLLKLETASPNAKKSAWGASLDAVAFLDHIFTLDHYLRWCIFTRNWWCAVWLLLILVVSFPIVIGLKIGRNGIGRLNMGRLSVVYDQAGKARVVAITNWWIQVVLKPLHDALFKSLERIECDGTFDQLGPFEKLILREDLAGVKFYSFDLSAATDRLPLDLQRDVLNILYPGLGTLWSNLLGLKWTYQGKEYKYSVGQPMGAYSSWAMLALTHHVVVRVAAHKVGLSNFRDYCILGDDIVIRNDAVASEYYNLMKALGVSINLSKSVESFDFAEFAKRWSGPGVQITPIGPGLTLRLVRSKMFLAMYLSEAWKLSLFRSLDEVLAVIRKLRVDKYYRSQFENVLWSSFGLRGFTFGSSRHMDVNKTIMYCFSTTVNYLPVLRYHICNALLQLQIDDIREAKRRLVEERTFFYQNWWKTYSTNWPMRLLEAFLKLVGPGFWVYATSFEESENSLNDQKLLSPDYSWDSIRQLVESDPLIGVDSIDWTQRKLIKDQSVRMRKFYKELERSQMEAPELFEENVFW
nr:MAG: putative RNA dependent RNA polymerase [Jiangsu mito-like virus 14]